MVARPSSFPVPASANIIQLFFFIPTLSAGRGCVTPSVCWLLACECEFWAVWRNAASLEAKLFSVEVIKAGGTSSFPSLHTSGIRLLGGTSCLHAHTLPPSPSEGLRSDVQLQPCATCCDGPIPDVWPDGLDAVMLLEKPRPCGFGCTPVGALPMLHVAAASSLEAAVRQRHIHHLHNHKSVNGHHAAVANLH